MNKYQFIVKPRVDLITRMYQDHGFTVDDICLRLRYPEQTVKNVIETHNLTPGEKSWRY